jgi:hypothetical protein
MRRGAGGSKTRPIVEFKEFKDFKFSRVAAAIGK